MTSVKSKSAQPRAAKSAAQIDAQKELSIKALMAVLVEQGVAVRREELKRGPGWRVMSGVCRVAGKAVLFVDRKVTLDEQIDVLVERVRSTNIVVPEEIRSKLPETVQRLLPSPAEIAA